MRELQYDTQATVALGPCVNVAASAFVSGMSSTMDGASGVMLGVNGGALAVRTSVPTGTSYDKRGHYLVTISAADLSVYGVVRVEFDDAYSTMQPVWEDFMVISQNEYDAKYGTSVLRAANVTEIGGVALASHASGAIPADVVDLLGTAWLAPATSGTPDVNVKTKTSTLDLTATEKASITAAAPDPWNTALPGAYASGKAGYIVGNTASVANLLDSTLSGHDASGTVGAALTGADALLFDGNGNVKADIEDVTTVALATHSSGMIPADLANVQAAVDFSSTMKADLATASGLSSTLLDTALSGHNVSGTVGEALGKADALSDPWSTALPGTYASGTAGYIIGGLGAAITGIPAAVWGFLTSAAVVVGSIGLKLASWVLGTDFKVILSANAHTGAVVPTVTNLTNAPGAGDFTSTMKASLNAATPVAFLSGDLTSAMKTSVQTAAAAALSAISLDKLVSLTMGASKPTVGSLLDKLMNASGSQTFDPTTDSLEAIKNALLTPTGAEDAVLDALLSSHTVVGSVARGIAAAGSLGDPWDTALPGAYPAGTAGFIIAAIDGLAAAVKAKTDNLTMHPADSADVPTTGEITAAILAAPYEGTETVGQLLAILRAVQVGLSQVAGGVTTFKSKDGTKARVTATSDNSGQRSAVTVDGT